MKRIQLFLFSAFLCILFLNGCGKKPSGKNIEINDNTPIHIKYDVGGKEPGTLDIIYKGNKVKMVVGMSRGGQTLMNVNLIIKDKMMYYVVEGDSNGIKSDISNNEFYKRFGIIFNLKDNLNGFEKSGTEDILGYSCEVYKSKDGDLLSVYKDKILFKKTSKDLILTSLLFEPDVKISDDIFELPKNVNYIDMDKMHGEHKMNDMPDMPGMMK